MFFDLSDWAKVHSPLQEKKGPLEMFIDSDHPELEAEFAYIGKIVIEHAGLGVDFIHADEPSDSDIGKRWLSTYIRPIQKKICTPEVKKKIDRLDGDDVAVATIIADAIATLFTVVPPFTIAKIITKSGYTKFCFFGKARKEAVSPKRDAD